jgi:hypothetical protein
MLTQQMLDQAHAQAAPAQHAKHCMLLHPKACKWTQGMALVELTNTW